MWAHRPVEQVGVELCKSCTNFYVLSGTNWRDYLGRFPIGFANFSERTRIINKQSFGPVGLGHRDLPHSQRRAPDSGQGCLAFQFVCGRFDRS
jgi:hypothetical protein